MRLSDIEPGSQTAYRQGAKLFIEQIAFELETCEQLFGIDSTRLMQLLASTPDWSVFTDAEEDA